MSTSVVAPHLSSFRLTEGCEGLVEHGGFRLGALPRSAHLFSLSRGRVLTESLSLESLSFWGQLFLLGRRPEGLGGPALFPVDILEAVDKGRDSYENHSKYPGHAITDVIIIIIMHSR